MNKFKTQINSKEYNHLVSLPKFISYYYQIKETLASQPKTILEIGVGNKFFYNYMKGQGFKIKNCDFDKSLNPDFIRDIKDLNLKQSFDTVVAFEVLEHLPFKYFQSTLKELKKASNKTVIISLPYSCISLDIQSRLRLPSLNKISNISINIPLLLKIKIDKKNKEHHWEIGRKNYPLEKIINILKQEFIIQKKFQVPLNPYHYFFILRKKSN